MLLDQDILAEKKVVEYLLFLKIWFSLLLLHFSIVTFNFFSPSTLLCFCLKIDSCLLFFYLILALVWA